MSTVLWASRHALDPAAEEALVAHYYERPTIVTGEILWPAGAEDCAILAQNLVSQFESLYGVWPAQAVEAFNDLVPSGSATVWAPVSVPETEPYARKVRPFHFVRWARIR
jgi:hypothetical protein